MERYEDVIRRCIEEALYEDGKFVLQDEDCIYGNEGVLDSFGLVLFITTVESKLSKELSRHIVITTDKAFSHRNSPFSSKSKLIKFLLEIIG